ncbi:hypothetical protein V6N13_080437 [Hibiscus sabdariffa]
MVQCLYNRQGQKLETYETIAAELIAFYSGSLGENDENVVSFPDSLVKEILGCMLSDENVVKGYYNWVWKKLLKLRTLRLQLDVNLLEEFKARWYWEELRHKHDGVTWAKIIGRNIVSNS